MLKSGIFRDFLDIFLEKLANAIERLCDYVLDFESKTEALMYFQYSLTKVLIHTKYSRAVLICPKIQLQYISALQTQYIYNTVPIQPQYSFNKGPKNSPENIDTWPKILLWFYWPPNCSQYSLNVFKTASIQSHYSYNIFPKQFQYSSNTALNQLQYSYNAAMSIQSPFKVHSKSVPSLF